MSRSVSRIVLCVVAVALVPGVSCPFGFVDHDDDFYDGFIPAPLLGPPSCYECGYYDTYWNPYWAPYRGFTGGPIWGDWSWGYGDWGWGYGDYHAGFPGIY